MTKDYGYKSKYDQIEKSVLEKIVPIKPVLPIVNSFIKKLEATAKKIGIDCRIVCGGSVAKNTHLQGDFDCDIFVRFSPEKYTDGQIAEELRKIVVAQKLNAQLLHGSRDYYKTIVDGITYELVPTMDVVSADIAPNVTDMSLFHVDWVNAHCAKKSGLNNQIRLAKAFCKAQGVYGAESYIGGFSGHVIDILVIHFGGFSEFLKKSLDIKEKEVIDVSDFYKGKNAVALMNESKLTSPFILIDPIVSSRNAASALTSECFNRFKSVAKQYVGSASPSFFDKVLFDPSKLSELRGVTYKISLTPLSDKKDIAGAQHVKILDYICEQALEHDFKVEAFGWRWADDYSGELFVRIEQDELEKMKSVKGPPVSLKSAVAAFTSVHKKVIEKDNHVWAKTNRRYNNFGALLDAISHHELVLIRARSFTWSKIDL